MTHFNFGCYACQLGEFANAKKFVGDTIKPDIKFRLLALMILIWSVWHLLDALKRFDSLDPRRVMEITFEVARLCESGLDYANPEKKYTLSAYPGESFSGLQLMCLMYAGFKRIAPDQDTGMDLNEPWITALELFNVGKPKRPDKPEDK